MTVPGRVLVTGGAGLIGSHIVEQLVAEGVDEVIVLDDFSRGLRRNLARAGTRGNVAVLDGDIRDAGLVTDVMEGVDTVFHQAALRITQCAREPRLAHEVLATGTLNVLEAAAGAGVKKVVAASSASVYGLADRFPTDEGHPPYNNDTLYGAAKVYLEGMLKSYRQMAGLDYVALRYFNVYGPRMDIHGKYTEVMIRWMERIENGRPPVIFGDGSQTMDFVYIDDVARANILAAKSDAAGEVFNVGSGTETSLLELASRLMAVMGRDLEIEFAAERAVNLVTRRLAGTEKAKRLLGFEARVPLDEGLGRLVAWWRAQRMDGETGGE